MIEQIKRPGRPKSLRPGRPKYLRPGRPKSLNKLTPAEKQAAYRLRCAARDQEQQKIADFKMSYEYEINYQIARTLENYQLSIGADRDANFAALGALERFKMIMDNKSNVTKIWNQDELF